MTNHHSEMPSSTSPALSQLVRIALPLIAAFLAQKGMQFIDTVMMGWLGPYALAAGALGAGIFAITVSFCMGILSAVGIFIARARGTGEWLEIQSSVHHGIYLALFLSVPGMLIIWNVPYVLLSFGEDARVVQDVILLLHAIVWGFPAMLLFLTMREFISAFALTSVVMLITIASIPLTFLANYLLIYGKFALPALGIKGIGYASAGVMWFIFLCLLKYSTKHHVLKKHFPALKFNDFDYHKILEMFKLGSPSGAILVLDAAMFLLAALMMGHLNTFALAAHQIAMQCVSISFVIPFALSMATALTIGHAMGAKDFVQAKRFAYLGFSLALMISMIIASAFIFIPEAIVKLFLNSTASDYLEIKHFAILFLGFAALFQCCDALQTIATGALRGLKDTFVPMLLSVGSYFLGTAGAYYFAFHTHWHTSGIWYGLTIGICGTAIVLVLRFFQRLRYEELKQISVLDSFSCPP